MRALLQKLYFNGWVRIPAKLLITFSVIKVVWDYSQYLTKWRRKNPQPRHCEFDVQSPANPCIPKPYHWYSDYEGLMNRKRYYRLHNDMLKLFKDHTQREYVLVDHPYRENRDAVDQLIMRAKEYSCSEHVKFYTINQYTQSGQALPQGVYREIREIRQPELEVNAPILPTL